METAIEKSGLDESHFLMTGAASRASSWKGRTLTLTPSLMSGA